MRVRLLLLELKFLEQMVIHRQGHHEESQANIESGSKPKEGKPYCRPISRSHPCHAAPRCSAAHCPELPCRCARSYLILPLDVAMFYLVMPINRKIPVVFSASLAAQDACAICKSPNSLAVNVAAYRPGKHASAFSLCQTLYTCSQHCTDGLSGTPASPNSGDSLANHLADGDKRGSVHVGPYLFRVLLGML